MSMQAYAMTEASHQMTSNPLPKHGPHKPGKAPVTLPSLGHLPSLYHSRYNDKHSHMLNVPFSLAGFDMWSA